MRNLDRQFAALPAQYRDVELPEYQGNPLIEALPPILSEDEALLMTGHAIMFSESERALSNSVRMHCVRRLEDLVVALPLHALCECEISILLRRGYVPRNPCYPSTWRKIAGHATARSATPIVLPEYHRPSSASMFLTGLSGIGKSTLLKMVLRTYPPVILHERYRDMPFQHTQIVWLKIDCPPDASLSGLCKEFFKAVDRLVGTDYARQWERGRKTIPDMQAAMERIAEIFFIGVLVIDELQTLSVAKAGGADKMINFFVTMINQIGIPIIFAGTYKIKDLFEREMRQARRVSDMGTTDFRRYEQGSELWGYLLDAIWQYQWVKEPQPLDEDLRSLLFDLTQGVTAILIGLFALAQAMAIREGYETVDTSVLQKVYDERLELLHPALNALRSNDPEQLALFDDLIPINYSIFEDNIFQGKSAAILERLRETALHGNNNKPSSATSPEIPASTVIISDEIRAGDLRGAIDEKTAARLRRLGIISSNASDIGKG